MAWFGLILLDLFGYYNFHANNNTSPSYSSLNLEFTVVDLTPFPARLNLDGCLGAILRHQSMKDGNISSNF